MPAPQEDGILRAGNGVINVARAMTQVGDVRSMSELGKEVESLRLLAENELSKLSIGRQHIARCN